MNIYETVCHELRINPKTWLITGVAGFIGSNLLEALLKLNQRVIGLDNFSTGNYSNLDEVKDQVTIEQWSKFKINQGDIKNLNDCHVACKKVDFVLHQAALGSVPRSIADPIATNQNNIDGFLNMLVAARDAQVNRFVYAASSSTYGDHTDLPKVEHKIGKPLSPYAVTKLVNELYADVFASTYNFKTIGLRYFNIFGKRQDPNGAYAAVIPKWINSLIKKNPIYINGDGETSRDFCYIDNAIQANILAATTNNEAALNQIYNIALGDRTSLKDLFAMIQSSLNQHNVITNSLMNYQDFRVGDIRHTQADITKAQNLLKYEPKVQIKNGISMTVEWYLNKKNKNHGVILQI